MHREIERKYLVNSEVYRELAQKKLLIKQGYICVSNDNNVRVRITDDKAYITIKGKSTDDGLSRVEWEKEIKIDEAKELFELCGNRIVEKYRYLVDYAGKVIEIDEFIGENEGLILAEVELEDVSEEFKKPNWLDIEVTNIAKYYNSYLSQRPFKKWSE